MEKLEVKCQVRADLRSPLPEALLRSSSLREDLSKKFGFLPRGSDDPSPEIASLLGRPSLKSAEGLAGMLVAAQRQRQLADFYGGTYTRSGTADVVSIVENLTIGPDSLYVRALAETEVCREILHAAVAIVQPHLPATTNLEGSIEGYAYATDSRVKLRFKIEKLLSAPLRDLLLELEKIARGDGEAKVIIHPWDLDFNVHKWDLSGDVPEVRKWKFRIYQEEFKHHDEMIYSVRSELKSDDHFSLIEKLEKEIERASG